MYFAVAGLDVLNELDSVPEERKKSIIEWIYSLQIVNEDGKTVKYHSILQTNLYNYLRISEWLSRFYLSQY